jgi:hypothetical protein
MLIRLLLARAKAGEHRDSAERASAPPGSSAASLRRQLERAAVFCIGGSAIGFLIQAFSVRRSEITTVFLIQDAPMLLLAGAFLFLVRWLTSRGSAVTLPVLSTNDRGSCFALCAAVATGLLAYAGSRIVYLGYALSMDEFMAVFDANIFRSGKLLAPIDPEWRAYAPALQPIFRLEIPGNIYWTSSYLPMNAAIRAAFGVIADPELAVPFMTAVALVLVFGVARQIWPDRPDAAVVSVLLLASSSQFLITAMTPYAMTAHLALNLLWLWLLQRDTRLSHGLAMLVALVACGLHQVIFHPLFAAPFVLSLWLGKRWRAASAHTTAYAVIGLFWILYWSIVLRATGEFPDKESRVGLESFISRVVEMITIGPSAIALMVQNTLRFTAWQNPLLVPLALVALAALRTCSTPLRNLLLGIALTLLAMFVLMPFQGHGWGYRYLHGLLGSFALLAEQGWIRITAELSVGLQRARLALGLATAISLGVILPYHAAQAHDFVKPYALASRAIEQAIAEIVIVDPTGIWYGADLVRNDPFLRGSPKVLVLNYLSEQQIADVCGRYRVAVFDRSHASMFGMRMISDARYSARNRDLREIIQASSCDRGVVADVRFGIGAHRASRVP